MKRNALIALSAISLAGCAGGAGFNVLDPFTPLPSRAETENLANYGTRPNDVPALVRAFYRARLIDPESVRYEMISTPTAGWTVGNTGAIIWGHRVCVRLNAKNRMGGYTGAQTDAIYFKGSEVSGFIENASRACAGVTS